MQLSSSSSSPAKRTRAKPKGAADLTAAPRKPRKKASTPAVTDSQVEMTALHAEPDDVSGMIATAAYFIAAERNFSPGHELDDWLAAERLVQGQLSG